MRISDWSSDVCSSDLVAGEAGVEHEAGIGEVLDLLLRRQQGLLRNAGYRAGLHVELHLLVHQNIHRGGRGAQLLEVTGLHHAQGPGAREVGEEEVVLHRSEEHTSELQSLMRISYAVFCLKKKNTQQHHT